MEKQLYEEMITHYEPCALLMGILLRDKLFTNE